jgi:hypothetical protein
LWDFWALMQDKYGAQWQFGDEPCMGWVHELQDITPEQVKQGVENLSAREDTKWPPNAVEFKALCLSGWEHKRYKPAAEVLGIESKTHLSDGAQEAGKAFFEDMRGLCN